MAISKEFWEELGVSIDDIIARQTEMEGKIFQSLAKKFDGLSPDFFEVIKHAFKIEGASLPDVLEALYTKSRPDFVDLYALAVFTEKNINPEIIYDIAGLKLTGEISRQIDERSVDSPLILLPLLKTDRECIRKIYYSHNIQRSAFKKYVCQPVLSTPISFEGVTSRKIENLLKEFENKKRPKFRRPVKLWWFEANDGKLTIVFRREKSASTQIKLVERNLFQRTGDEKIFIINDGGNVLELCSKREPKRTVKVAEFIINKITGLTVTYGEYINSFEIAKVGNFITRLSSNLIPNTELLSIRVRNVPLANSPTIEMDCSECIVPAIRELQETHGLLIMRSPQDVITLRVKHDGRAYNLATIVQGDKIEFISSNKNLRDTDKQRLSQFLNEQLQ